MKDYKLVIKQCDYCYCYGLLCELARLPFDGACASDGKCQLVPIPDGYDIDTEGED